MSSSLVTQHNNVPKKIFAYSGRNIPSKELLVLLLTEMIKNNFRYVIFRGYYMATVALPGMHGSSILA